MEFKPGQLVKIIGSEHSSGRDHFYGEITEVTGPKMYAYNSHTKARAYVYPVALINKSTGKIDPVTGEPMVVAYRPEHLAPIPGDKEPGSWDDCVFKPKELERV